MTAPDRHSRSFRIAFAALLGALATLGPFAVDTYLPAFGGMQKALGATPLEMQQTLSAYLLDLRLHVPLPRRALRQLRQEARDRGVARRLHGRLRGRGARRQRARAHRLADAAGHLDRRGRRRGPRHDPRPLPGGGRAAPHVDGDALLRPRAGDRAHHRGPPLRGVRLAVDLLVPGRGGARSSSWPGARLLRETLPEEHRHSFHPAALLRGYREVGASRPFLLLSLAVGFNFNAFFLYILSAPMFLSTHLGLGPIRVLVALHSVHRGHPRGLAALGAGGRKAFAARRRCGAPTRSWAFRRRPTSPTRFAFPPSLPWAVMPIFFYAIGSAMAMPTISLTTLDLFPDAARHGGLAAGLRLRHDQHAHGRRHRARRSSTTRAGWRWRWRR